MKYDGIETKVIVARAGQSLMKIILAGPLLQFIAWLLYKLVGKSSVIAWLVVILFTVVIILSVIFTIKSSLLWRLKYIHGRNDVPKVERDARYWRAASGIVISILTMIPYNIRCILNIIEMDYL